MMNKKGIETTTLLIALIIAAVVLGLIIWAVNTQFGGFSNFLAGITPIEIANIKTQCITASISSDITNWCCIPRFLKLPDKSIETITCDSGNIVGEITDAPAYFQITPPTAPCNIKETCKNYLCGAKDKSGNFVAGTIKDKCADTEKAIDKKIAVFDASTGARIRYNQVCCVVK